MLAGWLAVGAAAGCGGGATKGEEAPGPGSGGQPASPLPVSAAPELPPVVRQAAPKVCENGVNAPAERISYLSASFENSCGDCHGNYGEGAPKMPVLPGAQIANWEAFRSVVRNGRPGTGMPAFDEAAISDEQLQADWQKLTQTAPLERRTLAKAVAPAAPEIMQGSDAELQAAIADGLQVWRTVGKRGACANCHGPMPADLGRLAYRDSTILRRAVGQEIDTASAQRVVKMVHAVRAKYGMQEFCDTGARLFQPGGELLPGATELERDIAYNDELKAHGVDLDTPVTSAERARAVVSSILSLDIKRVRVAFPMNRWTEDAFHGDLHNTLAEWIPEYPREPKPGSEATWYALHDKYITDPSMDNLWAIADAMPSLTTAAPTAGDEMKSTGWMAEKYRSVLIGQHMLLGNVADYQVYTDADKAQVAEGAAGSKDVFKNGWADRDALWSAGEAARHIMRVGDLDATMHNDFPLFVQEKAGMDFKTLQRDTMRFAIPWFYMGQMFDPAMAFTNNGNASFEYAGLNNMADIQGKEFVLESTFRMFSALVNAVDAAPDTWRRDRPNGLWARGALPYWGGTEFMRIKPLGEAYSYNSYDPVQGAIYHRWMMNIQRTILYRILDDLQSSRAYHPHFIERDYVGAFTDDQLTYSSPEELPAMQKLRDDLFEALRNATETSAIPTREQ